MLIMYGYRRTSRSNQTSFIYIHMAMMPSISNATLVNHNSVSLGCHHRWQVHRSICEKWAVQMGGATKHSFISAYFLLSAYFLTAQSYKRMRLTTRVYGIPFAHVQSTGQETRYFAHNRDPLFLASNAQ